MSSLSEGRQARFALAPVPKMAATNAWRLLGFSKLPFTAPSRPEACARGLDVAGKHEGLWRVVEEPCLGSDWTLVEPWCPSLWWFEDVSQPPRDVGATKDDAASAEAEERRMMTFVRMQVFWGYRKLSLLFDEVRAERNRDPFMAEFYGYLQFPTVYNWRCPSREESRQMERWAAGLDDARLTPCLYQRARWLADERALARKRTHRRRVVVDTPLGSRAPRWHRVGGARNFPAENYEISGGHFLAALNGCAPPPGSAVVLMPAAMRAAFAQYE